jgi:hypothetical protein
MNRNMCLVPSTLHQNYNKWYIFIKKMFIEFYLEYELLLRMGT